jgi:putative transposase
MSRTGHCWDHASTESGFNRFQNARICGEPFATRGAMKATACAYIEVFYNRKRRHATLGHTAPLPCLKDGFNPRQGEKQVA